MLFYSSCCLFWKCSENTHFIIQRGILLLDEIGMSFLFFFWSVFKDSIYDCICMNIEAFFSDEENHLMMKLSVSA